MRNVTVYIPKKAFNSVYLPYLDCGTRYLVLYGGAGSGKSVFAAQRFLVRLLSQPICNLLVARKVGRTHKDSTFSLMKQIVRQWGLGDYFQFWETDMRLRCRLNGNEALFRGLDDTEKLKSLTFGKGDLTEVWIEEASEITREDFQQLDVRLRGKNGPRQMVLTFNPINVGHWLKQTFFDHATPQCRVIHTTYKDNAFLDEDYGRVLEGYKDTDPYYYSVYCLGQWGVTGRTVFPAAKVQQRLSQAPKPLYRGRFDWQEQNGRLTKIYFLREEDGCIAVYEEPQNGCLYTIGGDTAGEGSDRFAAQVINRADGRQAAVLCQTFDEDIYAKQVYCLGRWYCWALVGIETNFSTYPVRELQRLGYPCQYVRRHEDRYTQRPTESFGFQTNAVTRPLILGRLIQWMRDCPEFVSDQDTLLEMLTFVRNEKGRAQAQAGSHDDLIMALAIACFICEQQIEQASEEGRPLWTPDMWEDYEAADQEGKAYLLKKWGRDKGGFL